MTPRLLSLSRKILLLASAALLSLSVAGCAKKPPVLPPGALTDEQKAKLKLNAIKAYEQIVKDYPDSPHAAEARQRAQALKGPAK
jgi:predicted small lipoprotein YifL